MKSRIQVYSTTAIVNDQITVEEHINQSALELYDSWVCDRRWEPEDVKKLIDIAVELRNKKK